MTIPSPRRASRGLIIHGLPAAIAAVAFVFPALREQPSRLLPLLLVAASFAVGTAPRTAAGTAAKVTTWVVTVALFLLGGAVYLGPGLFIETRTEIREVEVEVPKEPPPPLTPEIDFTNPVAGAEVDGCFQFQFTARPPEGWTLVTSNRRGSDLIYFEGDTVSEDGVHWSAHTAVAEYDESATGDIFHLTVWMLPQDWAAYLLATHTDEENDQTWWASRQPPPEAIRVGTIPVRRSANAGCG